MGNWDAHAHNQHNVSIRHNVHTASSHAIHAARSWAMRGSMGVPLLPPATRKIRLSVVHDEHAARSFTAIGTEQGPLELARAHGRASDHYRFNITFARARAAA